MENNILDILNKDNLMVLVYSNIKMNQNILGSGSMIKEKALVKKHGHKEFIILENIEIMLKKERGN
jgi:hypothetical protein